MAVPATKFEVEFSMEVEARLARVEQSNEHIQRDIAEIKGDLRRLDGKIDAVKDSITALAEKVSASEGSTIRWAVGAVIAVAGLSFTIAKFVH